MVIVVAAAAVVALAGSGRDKTSVRPRAAAPAGARTKKNTPTQLGKTPREPKLQNQNALGEMK